MTEFGAAAADEESHIHHLITVPGVGSDVVFGSATLKCRVCSTSRVMIANRKLAGSPHVNTTVTISTGPRVRHILGGQENRVARDRIWRIEPAVFAPQLFKGLPEP